MKNIFKKIIILTMLVTAFLSCEKDDDSGIPEGQGEVKTSITDGPFPFSFVTEANVGVTKVEVKTATSDYVVLYEGSASYNLVDLTNGVTAEVEVSTIEAGTYTHCRVTVGEASVTYSDGTSHTASVDAHVIRDIAIVPALIVEEGEASEVLLDVDLASSFSFLGMGGLLLSDWILGGISSIHSCGFTPVVRVCDYDRTGEITGAVTVDGDYQQYARIAIEVDGETIHTHSESDGAFTFVGVAAGDYTVVVTTSDGETSSVSVTVSGTDTASCGVIAL